MLIKVTNWRISTLLKRWEKINEQPEYQRGGVWSPDKESLLIDSILRGLDIPKIYLRKISNTIHDWEVADGQQRLNAIMNFYNGHRKLSKRFVKGLNIGKIDGVEVGGLSYEDLPDNFKEQFLNTEVTISIVEECKEDEIRVLFGRLQEGVTLNAAEKRNSIISGIGKIIDSFVLNHLFFQNSRIPSRRFKHQDYMAKAFALIIYENRVDLKGHVLEQMYLDSALLISQDQMTRIDSVLDKMHSIDSVFSRRIKNEFTFIDIFWFLYNNAPEKTLNVSGFIAELGDFESKRLHYRRDKVLMDELLEDENEDKKALYDYILAYDRSGSSKENIQIRTTVFKNKFLTYLS